MMPLGSKLTSPSESQVQNIGTKMENFKILLSETRRCRGLIFGMWHLLVDLYKNCSCDAPKVKTGPAAGVTSSKHRNKQGKLQNSSSLKLESTEL